MLNYNNSDDTIDCVESIRKKTKYKNYEIIIVDNNSRKEEFEKLKNLKVNKLYRNNENLGFCGGNNLGIKISSGDYIVFLNNDTKVTESWLENLCSPLVSSKVAVSGGHPTKRRKELYIL